MTTGQRWTRDELLIALNVYHKLTFGQLHARQPVIVAVADKLRRTASSVAMKLCNFASLDPALKLRGVKGLEGASNLDREVWQGFYANIDEMAPASEEALRRLFDLDEDEQLEAIPSLGIKIEKRIRTGPTDGVASVKVRRGQEYFRESVINNCGGCCVVTGLPIRKLLIASHILPWAKHPEHRLNVRNGLCLSRLHDAAFDEGLIAFDEQMRLLIAPQIRERLSDTIVAQNFGAYERQPMRFPDDAVLPDESFLAAHRAESSCDS